MDRIKTILVATDHTAHSRRAELRAAMLGVELKVETIEVMSTQPEAAPALHRATGTDGQARTRRTYGAPTDIAGRAEKIHADLTVVAARRENFFAGLVARFRNDELIRRSERPVLLVNREAVKPYKKVVVGVDFSAESRQAARVALALAPTAHFTFLHAFRVANEEMMLAHEVPASTIHEYRIHARNAARLKLNGFIDALGPRRQFISRSIEHGLAGPTIDALAKEIDADLIALGKHGKSRFVELFLGSVTQRLSEIDHCDLLVTTTPYEDDPDLPPAA